MPKTSPPTPPRRLSLVAAMTENRVIGKEGGLPWTLPDEMQQFRALTLGHAVIMGRRNFEAEGKPLPHRRNIVLTRNTAWKPIEFPEIEVCHDLQSALALVGDSDREPFVIGGADIYALALPVIDRMYLTTIHAELEGDTFFPVFDEDEWVLVEERHHQADARHAFAFTMRILHRRPARGKSPLKRRRRAVHHVGMRPPRW